MTGKGGHGTSILPLAVEHVSYHAGGRRLLDDIDFELLAGPCTILLGPNGAGKSLTLRLCHGLLQPTRGAIRWRGPGASRARQRQAMVFQRPIMLRRSAGKNVAYALALRGIPRHQRRDRTREALAGAGLEALADRPARALSIGEQQRLALARAWALRPEVLFLDEPTASLDPAAMHAVEQVIEAIRSSGTKIIMTTHDLGQARRLASEVLFLHHGRLVERAPALSFFTTPASEEARAFLAGDLTW